LSSNLEWQFKAKLYLLSTEEGGRRTPFRAGIYRPHFSIDSVDIRTSCFIDRIEGKEEMRPGESGNIEARLLRPDVFAGLLQSGTQFTLREGHRVVGRGIIQEIR
jgi:elongation factor Tu